MANILYSDLSSLRDKINKVKTPKSYNDVVNLQASKLLRSATYSQPDRLGEIMKVMQHVDNTLVHDITQDEAINLISEVSSRLNAIAQSV